SVLCGSVYAVGSGEMDGQVRVATGIRGERRKNEAENHRERDQPHAARESSRRTLCAPAHRGTYTSSRLGYYRHRLPALILLTAEVSEGMVLRTLRMWPAAPTIPMQSFEP